MLDDEPQKKRKNGNGALTTTKKPQSSFKRQALRTGGWASPSSGGELKFVDVATQITITAGAVTWSAGTLLNGIAPGSTASNRIGRKVHGKSLLFRYSLRLAATSTGGSPVRILIVYDKQANAAAPAITDILTTDEMRYPNNLSNRDRFVTIFDHYTEPVSANANASTASVLFKRFDLETMFNAGAAGTIGDITSGSIYVFAAQTSSIATANATIDFAARYRYTDI